MSHLIFIILAASRDSIFTERSSPFCTARPRSISASRGKRAIQWALQARSDVTRRGRAEEGSWEWGHRRWGHIRIQQLLLGKGLNRCLLSATNRAVPTVCMEPWDLDSSILNYWVLCAMDNDCAQDNDSSKGFPNSNIRKVETFSNQMFSPTVSVETGLLCENILKT